MAENEHVEELAWTGSRKSVPQPALQQRDELTAAQQTEIIRRRQQARAHPELLEPWSGTMDRVRQRLHEVRRHKTLSR